MNLAKPLRIKENSSRPVWADDEWLQKYSGQQASSQQQKTQEDGDGGGGGGGGSTTEEGAKKRPAEEEAEALKVRIVVQASLLYCSLH